MKKAYLQVFLMIGLCLSFLMLAATTALAGSVVTISNVQIYPSCTGSNADTIMTYDWDRHEPIVSYIQRNYVNGNLYSESIDNPGNIDFWNFGISPYSMEAYGHNFSAAAPNSIYTFEFIWNGEKYTYSWNCTTGVQVSSLTGSSTNSDSPAPIYPPDNRLNPTYGDGHIAILYPNATNGINVYLYNGSSYISNFISEEDVVVGFSRTEGLVRVDVLEGNRIQFTIGADNEGKIYIISFDNLAGENPVGVYYDPNE